MSNGSAVRALTDTQTDTQTGPILYPRLLTREVMMVCCMYSKLSFMSICMSTSTLFMDFLGLWSKVILVFQYQIIAESTLFQTIDDVKLRTTFEVLL